MKRKRLDRDTWTCITEKRYVQKYVNSGFFRGIASVLYIDKVTNNSVWHYPEEDITVCESGMKWLQLMPEDENYVITAKIGPEGNIRIWYIDMIADKGVESDGIAFFDDLYLDLVVRPNGKIKIDDMQELKQAFKENSITEDQYLLALSVKDKLTEGLLKDIGLLEAQCTELVCIVEK